MLRAVFSPFSKSCLLLATGMPVQTLSFSLSFSLNLSPHVSHSHILTHKTTFARACTHTHTHAHEDSFPDGTAYTHSHKVILMPSHTRTSILWCTRHTKTRTNLETHTHTPMHIHALDTQTCTHSCEIRVHGQTYKREVKRAEL